MNLEFTKIDSIPRINLMRGKPISRFNLTAIRQRGAIILLDFRPSEFVVYPAHGVGQILAIEIQTVAGACLEYFAIYFAKSKMRLHVPTRKAPSIGMRKLSSSATIEQARLTLSEAPRRVRANWSRLVNEYEAKIKSGDILALAEATRDLYRRSANSEQSYSERQLYTRSRFTGWLKRSPWLRGSLKKTPCQSLRACC